MSVSTHSALALAVLVISSPAPQTGSPQTCPGDILETWSTPCSTDGCLATYTITFQGTSGPECTGCSASWTYIVYKNLSPVAFGLGQDSAECGGDSTPAHQFRCPCAAGQPWVSFFLHCSSCQ